MSRFSRPTHAVRIGRHHQRTPLGIKALRRMLNNPLRRNTASPIVALPVTPDVTSPTLRRTLGLLLFTLFWGLNGAAQAAQDTVTGFQYDANGNLTQIISPLDSAGNPVKTDYVHDALNRLDTLTQPSPAAGEARPDMVLNHDGQDQLISVDDPRQLLTQYGVDGLGNQNSLNSPDSGASDNTYDAAGNLKTHTDARGKVTSYSYDALNRLTQISYASGTPTVFRYDTYSADTTNPISVGQLTRIDDEAGMTIYFYDDAGRRTGKFQLATIANQQPRWPKFVSYNYGTTGNALGKLGSITYPSGHQINYSYAAAGRIQSITLNPGKGIWAGTDTAVTTALMTNIDYTPTGQFHFGAWGNEPTSAGSILTRAYDVDGRLWGYHLGNINQGGLFRYMQFDPASRITQMNHTGPAATANLNQSFSYDNLGRLTSHTRNTVKQSYSYDADGNRTTTINNANSYTHNIDMSSNRLLSTSGPAPANSNQYDLAGNLISDGTATYTYSDRSLLQTASKGSLTTRYTYNGLGQRITKQGATAASVVQYLYDEQGHLIGEYDSNGDPIQETVYLGDLPIAVLKQSAGVTSIYYIFADHLNTPRLITRATDNKIVWRWDQTDAFGAQAPNENPSALGTFTYNPRFPGQVYDAETGLHYNMHRYYDPKTGSYIQSDPIGLAGGVNTYTYVENNPLSYTDPSGLCPLCIPLAIAAIEAWNVYDTANDAVDTANVLGDKCSSGNDKLKAVGLFALGVVDPFPGNPVKKVAKGARAIAEPVYKTTKEAKAAAEALGFKKISETVHDGQAVFKRGKDFITRDLDGHNGGAWKMADSVKNLGSKETRSGTFDVNLNRIGD